LSRSEKFLDEALHRRPHVRSYRSIKTNPVLNELSYFHIGPYHADLFVSGPCPSPWPRTTYSPALN